MRTKKIRPLRTKIAATITIIVVISLLCVGAVALINTRRIADILTGSNKQMSATSGEMTYSSMDGMARQRLQELADDKAAIADRTFYEFQQSVRTIASAAELIYADSDRYPSRPVPLLSLGKGATCRKPSSEEVSGWPAFLA